MSEYNEKHNEEKCAVITGAAGFLGMALTQISLEEFYHVYAIVREGSPHNERLTKLDERIHVIECSMENYSSLHERIHEKVDVFFHLSWNGTHEFLEQKKNIDYTICALREASRMGCRRFVCMGSQAEYGVVPPNMTVIEELATKPITAYGATKVAACQLSRIYAKELGVEWIWCRIFSLIGIYEPMGRMLPDLYRNLCQGKTMQLSSCRQNWDYLDVRDAAEAIIASSKYGINGEIYNIASGSFRVLKDYTEELRRMVAPDIEIIYGEDPNPFISMQPSIDKIVEDTKWRPRRTFADSISSYGLK